MRGLSHCFVMRARGVSGIRYLHQNLLGVQVEIPKDIYLGLLGEDNNTCMLLFDRGL